MKITVNQYAEALYQSVRDKSQEEINVSVANFVKVLSDTHSIFLFPGIIKKFSEIWDKDHGIVTARVETAKPLSLESNKKIQSFISRHYNAKEVVLESKIDEHVKGGVVVRVGDEVWDGSVRRQLEELRKRLKK